jgi:hypothetical protein
MVYDNINLSSAILQRELGRAYKSVVNEMFDIISGYSIGNKCRTYRLKKNVCITDISSKTERINKQMATYMTFDSCINKILKGYGYYERLCAISHINKCYASKCKEDLIYKIDDTLNNRETNAYACLPKEIREHAIINGVKSVSSDICSSQPRTTIKVLKIDQRKEKDAILFTKLVNTGKIYDNISKALGITRKEAKIGYNASINSDCSMNSYGGMQTKANVSKYIKEKFPTVFNIVKEYSKINGKKSIGRACMSLEAGAVNDIVKKYNNVIPVYDQIYIFGGNIEEIQSEFRNSIRKHMNWDSINNEDMLTTTDHNEFLKHETQEEQGEENKEQRAIILVSKAKSPKMLAYLQRKTIHKWFDFGPIPIRI